MNMKVVVGLDKFTVGLKYPKMPKGAALAKLSVEEKQEIQQQQKHYIALGKHIESMVKVGQYFVQKTKQKGLRRYCVLSEQTNNPLFYFYFGCINKTWVINFEWNPSKHTVEERDEFEAALSTMLYDHYEELYVCGVVSHAEFCVDVYGVDISKLVLIENRAKSYQKVGTTTYSGRRGSAHVLTIYDKAKQLGMSGKHVRIEARIKRRDITLQQFVENPDAIPNPFGKAIIVDADDLIWMSEDYNIPLSTIGAIKELGLYGAVKNKLARQKIFTLLSLSHVEWLDPAEFWTQHQALLKGLEPQVY